MHEVFRKMIEEGLSELESEKERIESNAARAREVVERVKRDMAGLATFAEDLPTKMLEKFSSLLTAEFERQQGERPFDHVELRIGDQWRTLHGLGATPMKDYGPGHYRVIVILQKVD